MPPKALIINPLVHDFKLYDEWMHPTGLYFLISLLRDSGWDTVLINTLQRDTDKKPKRYGTGEFRYQFIEKPDIFSSIPRRYKRYGIPPDELRSELQKTDIPDAVMIGSSMTYWIEGLIETIRIVKEIYPDKPLFLGGTSAKLIPEIIRKECLGVNIVKGDATCIKEFIYKPAERKQRALPNNWSPSLVPGFLMNNQSSHAPLLTGIGCPYRCTYCASSLIHPEFRKRNKQIVIDEFKTFIDSGVTDFTFYDDALLMRPEQVFIPLLETVLKQNFSVNFHTPNGLHIRYAEQEILNLMKRSGFKTLRFGYETGRSTHTRGKAHEHDLKRLAKRLHKAGFSRKECGVYIMAGIPETSPESLKNEIDHALSLGLRVNPVFLSPVPGTEIYNIYSEKYRVLKHNPLSHNDLFFSSLLPEWGYERIDSLKRYSRDRNREIID